MIEKFNIDKVMVKYGILIRKIAQKNVKNKQITDDIIQDTFVKILEHRDVIKNDKNIKSYIGRIAFSTAIDYTRKVFTKYEVPYIKEYDDYYGYCFNPFESEDENNKEKDAIRNLVEHLPVVYSDVIICVYYKDMTIKETAISLGICESTVRTRLFRARLRLKEDISRCFS